MTVTEELLKLKKQVENCKKCGLYKARKNVVFGSGNLEAKIMFTGEGPGYWEDEKGLPFVGKAGKILDELLASIGLKREGVYITNILKCLRGDTRVVLENRSAERIEKLVKNRYNGRVLSVDKSGSLVAKKVINWYRTPRNNRKLYKVSFKHYRSRGKTEEKGMVVTEDHLVLTKNAWKRVDQIKNKNCLIATGTPGLSTKQKQTLYGILLGDSSITPGGLLRIAHSSKQREYLEFKTRLFSNLGMSKIKEYKVGEKREYSVCQSFSRHLPVLRYIYEKWYKKRRKIVPKQDIINYFSDRLLAFWYMDDGYLRKKKQLAEIASNSFTKKEAKFLVSLLKENGFDCWIRDTTTFTGCRIQFSVVGTRELCKRVAKFIPESMRYKLIDEAKGIPFKQEEYVPDHKTFWDNIVIKLEGKRQGNKERIVYCIDVEDTRNFVTLGGVVHNCRPPNNRNPTKEEIKACTPYLDRQIAIIKPKIICTLGNFATSYILERFGLKPKNISKIHGEVFNIRNLFLKAKIIPLYHPATATYNPRMKEILIEDFKILKKLIKC